jgi:hypothetical protein
MRALNSGLWAVLSIVLFIQTTPSLAQTVCDAAEVKLGNNYIQVAPTGSDDTENIQCALDLAAERNIPKVRLTRGDFYTGALVVRNFVGTLQGVGRDHTRLRLTPREANCGYNSAHLTFAGGEPRVRWLSMIWGARSCTEGWYSVSIWFTGASEGEASCARDTMFATVDNVSLLGLGVDASYSIGILVAARASENPDCANVLLGTLRVNRSSISGFETGASVNLQGDAQVGIFNNEFTGDLRGLVAGGSYADLTISGNHFASVPYETPSSCHGPATGLSVNKGPGFHGITWLSVHGNVFDVVEGGWCDGTGISLWQGPEAPRLRAVVSGNRFRLRGFYYGAMGIRASGVSGAVVSGNFFEMETSAETETSAASGLYVTASSPGLASDWTVVSNSGFGSAGNQADIILDENTRGALIGPWQGATVIDLGFDNTVLPQ